MDRPFIRDCLRISKDEQTCDMYGYASFFINISSCVVVRTITLHEHDILEFYYSYLCRSVALHITALPGTSSRAIISATKADGIAMGCGGTSVCGDNDPYGNTIIQAYILRTSERVRPRECVCSVLSSSSYHRIISHRLLGADKLERGIVVVGQHHRV